MSAGCGLLLLPPLLLLLPAASAQTYHWGPCPSPKVQPGFNLERVRKNQKLKKAPGSMKAAKGPS